MATYPETPPGWTAVDRRHTGPFTTHVTFLRDDGGTTEWHSRAHRKCASLISRPGGSGWWAPRRISWWIAVLFIICSACFVIAPFPGFVQLVGAAADAAVFFVGSIFFTRGRRAGAPGDRQRRPRPLPRRARRRLAC